MSEQYGRHERVSSVILRTLGQLLQFETKDPRLKEITLTAVRVSKDLSHAKIYFVCQDADKRADIEKALTKASGYFRSELAGRLALRVMPALHFAYDTSVEHGANLTKLIDEAMTQVGPEEEDTSDSSDDSSDSADEKDSTES